ncbi:hypothetical protein ACJ73_01394 [Blastomyces percursus]|uniref:Uncharacterized protein n=1 Tax=Blastomyces percursus TaxID=1658174 RepID=A0A1J9QGI5_9EURO|nr:hypothetical protein ACJ73_01394 [Blastomyces percursus]
MTLSNRASIKLCPVLRAIDINAWQANMGVIWQLLLLPILILFSEIIRQLLKSKAGTRKESLDLENLTPYPVEQIKGRAKYRTNMGLKRLDQHNWLTIDKNYIEQHKLRDALLRTQRSKVFQCLPEARNACEELLNEVATYLCGRYPAIFAMDNDAVRITKTDEVFCLRDRTNGLEPLEVAARLAMEDFSIVLENDSGQSYLAATASLFPVGWCAMERIGYTIAQMHGPVPLWHKEIEFSVNKSVMPVPRSLREEFLSRLAVDSPMERSSYFIQVIKPGESLSSILFQPVGLGHRDITPRAEDILIRRERQTFRRLSKSRAIVFGVKTSLTRLQELPLEELKNLVTEIKSWPDAIGKYKGRDHWGSAVIGWMETREGAK